MSNFFGGILGKVILYSVLALLAFVGVNSVYDDILHAVGFETKADVQAKLLLSQKEVLALIKVNEDINKELKNKTISELVTNGNLNMLLNNHKEWNKKSKLIISNKNNKPISNDPVVVSEQQIDSIWEMYCGFNATQECKGESK